MADHALCLQVSTGITPFIMHLGKLCHSRDKLERLDEAACKDTSSSSSSSTRELVEAPAD